VFSAQLVPARQLLSRPTRRSSDLWGGTEGDADELVRAGMWAEDEHDGDPGYQFVNWAEYQPMKADVEAKREYERERKRRQRRDRDRKSTRLNSSHVSISYAVFCLK